MLLNMLAAVRGQANQSKKTILPQISEMPAQKNEEVPGFFNHFLRFTNAKVWVEQAEDTTPEMHSLNTPINQYYIKSGIKSTIL